MFWKSYNPSLIETAVVCLQAMKFGLKGVIMYCKHEELEIGAGNKTIMQRGNYRWEGAGWIRAAQPSLREMRLHQTLQGSARSH